MSTPTVKINELLLHQEQINILGDEWCSILKIFEVEKGSEKGHVVMEEVYCKRDCESTEYFTDNPNLNLNWDDLDEIAVCGLDPLSVIPTKEHQEIRWKSEKINV